VTFVFTDIEGSTQRWERDRAAMQDAVCRHDVLVRAAITKHGGYVFKAVGDAFCAAFGRPEDAIAAMLDAQSALAAEDFSAVDGLRVRAAIHTGTADERDGDYFGPAVNRVARLLAIGHGSQVLVSGVTTDLAQGTLLPQASLRDLGEHRLKDLARPEQVYQLIAPGLPSEFPPLRSLDAQPNNLPLQLTSFVGRETEIAEITALLQAHRLVTLVGSGGVGKTRTSLQVAANLLDGLGDGVWFIEFAPLSSGEYIPTTVAQALGLTLASDGDPVGNLVRALKATHALLVFDNCEHLVEPAARVSAAILRGCPKVKILASSRQGLGIAGEETYRLPALDVPTQTDADSLKASDAAQSAAIALFVERARSIDKRFVLTDENAATVAEICRRLDGIPLAIELAAARVKIFSPRQLREHLNERFRVLTGGSRDALPHQQTLRSLIDWSHDLLDERERRLIRRVAIFVNGFTLEGAVAVGSGDDLDERDVFDVLASLVDKSLVLAEPAADALRYRLLESTRVYAREKLEAAGEREACAERHLRYLRNCFVEAKARSERTGLWAGLENLLATELEDVREALDWGVGGAGAPLGGELLAASGDMWANLGLAREGIARIEALLAVMAQGDPRILARLWTAVAWLAGNSARPARAFEAAMEAVAYGHACGDPVTLANALSEYAWSAALIRRLEEAETALAEAESIPGDSVLLRLRLLDSRAYLSMVRGDFDAAANAYEQLRREHRSLGNAAEERMQAVNLADVEHARGQTERAIAIVREVLNGVRAQRNRGVLAILLANLAGYLAAVDDLPEACAAAREAIRVLAREPEHDQVAWAIEHLALVLALGGDLARAAALAGYADAALRRYDYDGEFTERTTRDRLAALMRERLPSEERERHLAEGAALTSEAAVALALEES
jgi:predicted ATPase/class 3 adenylate cyclase